MKKLLSLLCVALPALTSLAQCPSGYNTAAINWDALDFLTTNGAYSPFVTASVASSQNFAFGTQKLTLTHSYTGANNVGENTAHTGETGSYGAGADVQFIGDGTITVTFQSPVQNVQFSLYDIDRLQRASFNATNSGVPAVVNLTTLGGASSILTITNNNTNTSRVDATNTSVANTSVNAAVNVLIAGPVTSFTITITGTTTVTSGTASSREDGSFWLSDISACTAASNFPTNYYAVSQPFTNQPGYVLSAVNNSIYQVNPANGVSKLIFTDPGTSSINSLAYDPYNRIVYYTYNISGSPATDKTVKKYTLATKSISIAIADVTSLGIPVYENGVESAAAAFYNGSLFLGVEGYNIAYQQTDRKSIVWRIDFNGSGTATGAAQVYGTAADNGSSIIHDWADIGINNGVLYDFDAAVGDEDIYQYDMQSGAVTRYTPTFIPRQVAVDWTGKIYAMDNYVTPYNGTTGLNMAQQFSITSTPAIAGGSIFGDAAEAFRPLADFGDAPSSYDPVALSPAVHEISANLHLGNTVDDEWTKKTSALANGDTDDGMPYTAIINQSGNYLANVNVYNNTGANATVCAWVDFNNNGTFETSEGIMVTVPSSPSLQNVDLFWPNPVNNFAPYSYTFIRIRVTSQSNGMTAANPTGYYPNGEVEDYRVQVNAAVLPVNILAFTAKKLEGERSGLHWKLAEEQPGSVYEIQKSANGQTWAAIHTQTETPHSGSTYNFTDNDPFAGMNYYRLKILKADGRVLYSPVEKLNFEAVIRIGVAPNPAKDAVNLSVEAGENGVANIRVTTIFGSLVYQTKLELTAGKNVLNLPLSSTLSAGAYTLEVWIGNRKYLQRLLINR